LDGNRHGAADLPFPLGLGVHFLSDVLLGLLLGVLLLLAFSKLQKPLGSWLKNRA